MIDIYRIFSLIDDSTIYVGSSSNFKNRAIAHARAAVESSDDMYLRIRELGVDCWIEVIDECDESDRRVIEDFWVHRYDCLCNGYNKIAPGAYSDLSNLILLRDADSADLRPIDI